MLRAAKLLGLGAALVVLALAAGNIGNNGQIGWAWQQGGEDLKQIGGQALVADLQKKEKRVLIINGLADSGWNHIRKLARNIEREAESDFKHLGYDVENISTGPGDTADSLEKAIQEFVDRTDSSRALVMLGHGSISGEYFAVRASGDPSDETQQFFWFQIPNVEWSYLILHACFSDNEFTRRLTATHKFTWSFFAGLPAIFFWQRSWLGWEGNRLSSNMASHSLSRGHSVQDVGPFELIGPGDLPDKALAIAQSLVPVVEPVMKSLPHDSLEIVAQAFIKLIQAHNESFFSQFSAQDFAEHAIQLLTELYRQRRVVEGSLAGRVIKELAVQFAAKLDSGSVVPLPLQLPQLPQGGGGAILAFNHKSEELKFTLTYGGLIGTRVVAIHFHLGPPGSAGPVVQTVCGGPTPALFSHCPSPTGTLEGIWKIPDPRIPALQEGYLYLQIHTDVAPAGELRGQIVRIIPILRPWM